MGKRSAEKQLTQLNQFEEETDTSNSDQSSAQGFRKADQTTLAQRVIKVPKSRLRPTPIADAAADKPATSSAFSGFSGFGSPAAPAPVAASADDTANDTASESSSKGAFKGFSFGQPADGSKPAAKFGAFGAASSASAFKIGAFGAAPAASKEATSAFSFSTVAPSTTSEEPAKSGFTFDSKSSGGFSIGSKPAEAKKPADDVKQPAAFSMPAFKPPTAAVAGSSAFASQPSKPTFTSGFVPPVAASGSSAMEATDASEEEFFKGIRGLNISLQKRIADALDVNAFVDLTPLLQQYRDHWDSISKSNAPATSATETPAFDSSRLGAVSQPSPAPASTVATVPVFNFGGAASSTTTAAAPAAASGFFSFGSAASKAAAPAATTDGSGAKGTATKTSFSFGFAKPADQATSSEEEKKPFSFGFGAQKPVAAAAATAAAAAENEEGSGDEKEEEEEKREPTTAGEEGETTEHQTRAKLYAWDKASNKYKDLGVGNFKVNTRPADNGGKRARFICRQEGSERITLNAAMFKAMTLEIANKRDIGILVITDNLPTRYLVRVKTAAMAQDLFGAMERVRDQLPA
ncbi:hypothetical protein IWW39_004781 [Coemansia spiralis]|uniref:RanBD1 domain-containing protein n=1 Tax=Coemansia spiralis TaxID=417178 RepID=A0A9W8GIW7_9FUNG|nr:hypothetical protein IWW39_004781 [Coemansia spiralis]